MPQPVWTLEPLCSLTVTFIVLVDVPQDNVRAMTFFGYVVTLMTAGQQSANELLLQMIDFFIYIFFFILF